MHDTTRNDALQGLDLLASSLARRDLRVEPAKPGSATWTDGRVIFVDGNANPQERIIMVCVQSALLAAGSLEQGIARKLLRRPQLARRYLAVEAPRALAALQPLLPPAIRHTGSATSVASDSPATSLRIAQGDAAIASPPAIFGSIDARALLAVTPPSSATEAGPQHIPRKQADKLTELAEDATQDESDDEDFVSSPVGGGGGIGKLLQKMFQMVRRLRDGGTPGADAPTHWSRVGPRAGIRGLPSTANAGAVEDLFGQSRGILYPEWDPHRRCYRPDWCTVTEIEPPSDSHASVEWMVGHRLRKPLARLGMGLDRFRRRAQGDDIDIDAAIEAQLGLLAGSPTDEAFYLESLRRRRDLSVLLLLDISGSVTQDSPAGGSVHDQQRSVATELMTVLHEIGDRVALYAFHSQGRSAVHLTRVKRFDEELNSTVMRRLSGLRPGAYSRLGAAIRHAATVLLERGGTSRRLLVVLSDGLAYDHGYEPAYGRADARKALAEARRDGVGCLCLSIGANTDTDTLRQIFGSAAHASIPKAEQVSSVIGPLFRSALRSAEVKRRIA